jgi:hypothetical protein
VSIEVSVDSRALKAALAKAKRSGPPARRNALLSIASAYGKVVMSTSPVDTGRFKAAEAQGLNQAGAGPFPVQPVRTDDTPEARAWRAKVDKTLAIQLNYWKGQVAYYESRRALRSLATGKQNKAYRVAKKNLERAQQYLAEWKASEGTGAVIGVEFWQRLREARRRKDQNPDMVLTRAYSKVYGGTGQLIQYNGREVISLRNLEPHAYIVEHNKRVRANALRAMAGTVKRASQAYTKQLAAASSLALKG